MMLRPAANARPAPRILSVVLLLSVALLAHVATRQNATYESLASSAAESLAFYQEHVCAFIGGYTVAGTSFTQGGQDGSLKVSEFEVQQECLCEVVATAHGIFARGANDANAFSLVAALEPDGEWHAQQVSVGTTPAYQATMRFGRTPGGAHTAVGFYLNPVEGGAQTTFRASQSAIGCKEGVGAAACDEVCERQGLSSSQVASRCGAPLPPLDGAVLTDWEQRHPDGSPRTSAGIFRISLSGLVSVIGSDDGITFWTMHGARTGDSGRASAGIVVDFAPKGGPPDLPGVWFGDRIAWQDGNVWSARNVPSCVVEALTKQRADPECWQARTGVGARLVLGRQTSL